ncbi:MAG: tetratricopeptide repeat protein [Planctomycetota bacterium]
MNPWQLPTTRFATLLATIACVAFLSASSALGLDRIRDRNGVTSGKITKMSALSVTITRGGVDTKKPVEDIVSITFDDEPEDLAPARRAAERGRYQDAIDRLGEIDRGDVDRKEIQQEIDYLECLCTAQLALAGQGSLDRAEGKISKFLSSNSRSYRVPETIELRGNVLLAKQDYDGARAQYAKLGKAPAPYFKARSALLTGRSLQAEGDHQQAAAAFDSALDAAKGNAAAESQQLEATLLGAVSQAALGDVEQSTETIKQIIEQSGSEDTQLLAQAYNALGDCHLQAGNAKAAKLAFLHVDLLFRSATAEHARALYELSRLWNDLGQGDRARDAKQRLKEEYPGSRWANR